ncbi:hypothetical protein Acr_15g0011360 [Actinidia rufa]|uniref:DUF7138 domain-containing protein n=1 Tax=Actinidia rufa TaxID=165716 RepID=A0A7J0FX92_9ERIC|nr:hypothetical protein Acr_15g0011360 [Actinidia rufa]
MEIWNLENMEDGDGACFSVTISDGNRERNIGSVKIHPSLEFKTFQLGLSHRIGISHNNFSVYLVDRKNSSQDYIRKTTITGKVNFGLIAKQKDCFFLLVLRKARRNRSRNPKPKPKQLDDYFSGYKSLPSPENFALVERNPQFSGITKFSDYSERLRNLQIREEHYATMMKSNSNFDLITRMRLTLDLGSGFEFDLDLGSFPRIEESLGVSATMETDRSLCEECAREKKNGVTAPFHHCVYDAVILGFRTSAGPIARPRSAFAS